MPFPVSDFVPLIYLAGGLAAAFIFSRIWGAFLRTGAAEANLGRRVLAASRRPLAVLVFLAGAWLAGLNLPGLAFALLPDEPAANILRWFDGGRYALTVLALTFLIDAWLEGAIHWYLAGVASRTNTNVPLEFLPILRRLSQAVFLIIAASIILPKTVAALVTTAGVASLAVALAAQETLANIIAGLVLMVDRPFRQGDRVELAPGLVGDVLEVGLRTTRILSLDNTVIIVPNKEMAQNRLVNLSSPDPRIVLKISVTVAMDTDLEKAKAVLLDVCRRHPSVLDEPAPAAYFVEIVEVGARLQVWAWIADVKAAAEVRDQLNTAFKQGLAAEGITLPLLQREVRWVRGAGS